MRVLVTATDVHCWLLAGHFTIHADGSVTWRTPYDPMKDFARFVDDDIVVPPGAEGALPLTDPGVVDVLLLDDTRAAVAYREPPRIEIVTRATHAVLDTISLTGSGPRVPDLRDEEEWCEDETAFRAGFGTRGIRLSPASDGILITARDSGHVAHYSFATRQLAIWRLPGVPENTYHALETGPDAFVVGILWNGRHSELRALDRAGRLQGRWPERADEVRWGMPAPVLVDGHVLTYSDEGPHARELALLDAMTLEEVDHAPVPSMPVAAHAHGPRFATVSSQHVVLGTVKDGGLSIEVLDVGTLMKRAGLAAPARSVYATDDKRGTRVALDHEVTWVGYDGDIPVIARKSDSAIVALEPGGPRTIVAGDSTPRASIWDPPTVPAPLHVRGGRLLTHLRDRVVITDLLTGEQVARYSLFGVERGWLVGDGVFHLRQMQVDDEWVLSRGFTPIGGKTRELAQSPTTFAPRDVVAIAGKTVWWCERANQEKYVLCHYTIGAAKPERLPPIAEPRAIAVHDGVLYALMQDRSASRQALYRRDGDGFTQLASEGLPYFLSALAVSDTAAYAIEPITHGRDGIAPSRLFQIDLATGAVSVLATSTVGELRGLHIADGELRWYESGAGETALCRLPLGN